jgi:hypothetical protein
LAVAELSRSAGWSQYEAMQKAGDNLNNSYFNGIMALFVDYSMQIWGGKQAIFRGYRPSPITFSIQYCTRIEGSKGEN